MAEVTAMRNNALPYPVYGLPYVVTFPMLDADGDLVTGATTPDAEISKNGDTFADCTNESTEIATNSGTYYLSLTSTELTTDVATIIAKSATAGMKTTVLTLYPRKLVTIRTGTSASGGVSTSTIVLDGSASAVDDFYNGMIVSASIDGTTEVRMITDYAGSTQTATVTPDWTTAPDNNDTFTVYLPDGVQIQQANTTLWLNSTVATPTVAGVPEVDVTHFNGSAGTFASGRPEVKLADVAHGGTSATITAERIIVASTTSNEPAVKLTGNGSGAGLLSTGGATGDGFKLMGGATSGDGIHAEATTEGNGQHFIGRGSGAEADNAGGYFQALGSSAASGIHATGVLGGAAIHAVAGATGVGVKIVGGGTSGAGIGITTTSGDGIDIAPTAGHGIDIAANGTSKHGVNVTGGTAGTSDGIKATAGTGGVDIRGGITGNVTGNLSGSVGSVTAGVTVTTNNDKTGYTLTGTQTFDNTGTWTGNITGNLSGSVGSVTGAVGSVTGNVGGNVSGSVGSVSGNVGGNVSGSIGSLAAQAKTDVNAEVVDALATDTYAEPGQGAPAATTTLAAKVNYLYKAWRNKKDQTSSQYSLYADDASTVDQKAAVSNDGTTTTIGEVATGP